MIVGTEWLIEAEGCNQEKLRDESVLQSVFASIVGDLGLKVIDSVWHKFEGEGGVTGLSALTESHLACHTYPEHSIATFNLYCCRTRPEWNWEENLRFSLDAKTVHVRKIERGEKRNAGVPPAVLSASRTQVDFDDPGFSLMNKKLVSYGDVKIRERGRLPHWEKENGIYFVTFRLADSLPKGVLKKLAFEREEAEKSLNNLGRKLSEAEKKKLSWLFSEKVDEFMDHGYGGCLLREPKFAKIVADALLHFDGRRYLLHAWCVMPNHVHVVFQPIQKHKLNQILHAWKSFTAHEINKALSRTGEFWQREYYDHLIRDTQELDRIIAYTLNNPAKAGLKNWKWVGSFGKSRSIYVP